VDEVKHLNRSIMMQWTGEKLKLEDKEAVSRRFFVRMSGDEAELLPRITDDFGKVKVVKVPEFMEEFGFITEVMTEGAYEKAAEGYSEIIHMIRVED